MVAKLRKVIVFLLLADVAFFVLYACLLAVIHDPDPQSLGVVQGDPGYGIRLAEAGLVLFATLGVIDFVAARRSSNSSP